MKCEVPLFNPFPAIHDNCRLLYCLLIHFGNLYCKVANNMNPDPTAVLTLHTG